MSMEINLSGKSVLVTGAGRGLGYEIARGLYKNGATVYALGRNINLLKSLETECPGVHILIADLEDIEQTKEVLNGIGLIDCIVNNAAYLDHVPLLDQDHNNFLKMFKVNVVSVLSICQILGKRMIENKIRGSIVNVSGLGSKMSFYGMNGYGSSKAGLDRLTSGLAQEFGPYGIRVNSILPTVIETDMSGDVFKKDGDIKGNILNRTPIGKFPNLQEIVNMIIFMLSDVSPTLNGEHIVVDGGYQRN